MKRTPTLELRYDESIDSGMRITELLGRGGPGERRQTHETREQVLADPRSADTLRCSPRTRTPTATRWGRCSRCTGSSSSSARTCSCTCPPTSSRCPWEYRHLTFDGLPRAAARRPRRAHDRVPRLRQHRPHAGRLPPAGRAHILNIDHHHDNTRFGTVNFVVPEASSTAEIVWGLMQGARRRDHAEIARRALHRAGHRHRALHVREHQPARPPDGGGADRRRRGAAQGVPAPLRGPAREPAAAAGARARRRRALRRRAADARPPEREDYEDTGAEETHSEGVIDHLRAVQGTAVAALVRELLGDDRVGMRKVSLRATDGRVDVSRSPAPTAAAGTRRPPASPPTLSSARAGGALRGADRTSSSDRRVSACATPERRRPALPKPAGVTSHDVVAGSGAMPRGARRSATRARSTRSPPACCSCSSAGPRGRSAS